MYLNIISEDSFFMFNCVQINYILNLTAWVMTANLSKMLRCLRQNFKILGLTPKV